MKLTKAEQQIAIDYYANAKVEEAKGKIVMEQGGTHSNFDYIWNAAVAATVDGLLYQMITRNGTRPWPVEWSSLHAAMRDAKDTALAAAGLQDGAI